jgi:glucokinase
VAKVVKYEVEYEVLYEVWRRHMKRKWKDTCWKIAAATSNSQLKTHNPSYVRERERVNCLARFREITEKNDFGGGSVAVKSLAAATLKKREREWLKLWSLA